MLITDSPIKRTEDDILERTEFAHKLAKSILDWEELESTVVGLYGPWGSGKTSIINLITNYIEEQTSGLNDDKRPVLINFNPWNFSGQNQLLTMFFQELAKGLESSGPSSPKKKEIGEKLIAYSKFLNPLSFIPGLEPWISLLKKAVGSAGEALAELAKDQEKNLSQMKNDISELLLKKAQKIIIFIDDIDRLIVQEAKQIFQLIKLTADFPKTIYVVAFDPEVVEKMLEDNNVSGKKYLQKIIQHQIVVPSIEQTSIDKFLLYSDHPLPKHKIDDLETLSSGERISVGGVLISVKHSTIDIKSNDTDKTIRAILPKGRKLEDLDIKKENMIYIYGILNKDAKGMFIKVDEDGEIIKYHISWIDSIFGKLNINQERIAEFDRNFPSIYNNCLRRLFSTLRQAKRYINSLLFDLPQIKDEVNLYDFLILEAIKLFAPEIYNDIPKSWWIYVDHPSENIMWFSPLSILYDKKEEKKEIIKKHISGLLEKSGFSEQDQETFIELLSILFPNVNEAYNKYNQFISDDRARAEKRIYSSSFSKYFTLKIATSKEFPDAIIESIIALWNKSSENETEKIITKTFQDFKSRKVLLELLKKLLIFSGQIESAIGIFLIRSIYRNLSIFSDKEIGGVWNSEYQKALSLLLLIIDEKIEKNKIQNVFEEIVSSVTSFGFATNIVYFAENQRGDLYNIYENVDVAKLKKILSSRLHKYFIEEERDIFKEEKNWAPILSRWTLYDSATKKQVNEYVFSLIEKQPEYLGKIVNSSTIHFEHHPQFDYQSLTAKFDKDKLYRLIKEKGTKSYSNEKEKKSIDYFIKRYEQDHHNNNDRGTKAGRS